MTFTTENERIQDETISRILRKMLFPVLITDCRQKGSLRCSLSANGFAAQPVRPRIQQYFAGHGSVIRTNGGLRPANTGLRREESSDSLRS